MKQLPIVRVICVTLFLAGKLFSQDSFVVPDALVSPELMSSKLLITPAVILKTGESDARRWISISMGHLDSSLIPLRPEYTADGSRGSFSVELAGLDPDAFLESKWQRVYGMYPLQYEVEFVDSVHIKIKGRTLPFVDMECSYSFNRNEYRIEFNYEGLDLTGSLTDSQGGQKNDLVMGGTSEGAAQQAFEVSQGIRSAKLMPLLYNSMYIAVGAVILVFAILLGIQMYKKIKARKSDHTFADMLDAKSPPIQEEKPAVLKEPEILTPEMREDKIRAMMASDTISYDEAALRVQYESMK